MTSVCRRIRDGEDAAPEECLVVFSTQSLSDLGSGDCAAIIESCPTRLSSDDWAIYHRSRLYRLFRLTTAIEILRAPRQTLTTTAVTARNRLLAGS